MKWSAIKLSPRLLRSEDAAEFVGGEQVLKDLEASGWIAPVRRAKRMTLWDAKLLDAACDRLTGETPAAWTMVNKHCYSTTTLNLCRLAWMAEWVWLRCSLHCRHSRVPTAAEAAMVAHSSASMSGS